MNDAVFYPSQQEQSVSKTYLFGKDDYVEHDFENYSERSVFKGSIRTA